VIRIVIFGFLIKQLTNDSLLFNFKLVHLVKKSDYQFVYPLTYMSVQSREIESQHMYDGGNVSFSLGRLNSACIVKN